MEVMINKRRQAARSKQPGDNWVGRVTEKEITKRSTRDWWDEGEGVAELQQRGTVEAP